MTMNDTWGFKSYDNNWKPVEGLIRNLADIASKGGNYLLNVGPTSEGLIPQPSIERLAAVGKWMEANGEAIYATTASPFKKLTWGRCTQKPGKLYLHVFNWPKDGKLVVPVSTLLTRASLLTAPQADLAVSASPRGQVVTVPVDAPDPVDTVVVAEYQGELQVLDTSLAQAEDGTVALAAADAEISGETAKLEGGEEQNIGYWVNANDMVTWQVQISQPGTFEVELNVACQPESAGSVYVVVAGDQAVGGRMEATGGWQDFRTVKLGRLTLTQPGRTLVAVRAVTKPNQAVMNLRSVTLRPVAP
jgi:alpha-L-fucosidase